MSSDSLLSHLFAPASPVTETDSAYTTTTKHCELHPANNAPSDLRQVCILYSKITVRYSQYYRPRVNFSSRQPGKQCIPDGSAFQKFDLVESELLSRANVVESWVDERTSAATLKISLPVFDTLELSTGLFLTSMAVPGRARGFRAYR